jgi:hypothetical protein
MAERISILMGLSIDSRMPLRVLAVLVCAVTVVSAGQIVQFEDGRVLEVERVRPAGDVVELELEGGGVLAVPAWRVTGWRAHRPAPRAVPTASTAPPAIASDAWRSVAGAFAAHIERAAAEHRLDPILLTAVARMESAFDPGAVSPKGASGLMQLMPQTAERFGVADIFDASQNVNGGARYLSWLLERFEGNTELALAGYNAGENAVDRYNGVPPYPETQNYVRKVMREADRLRSEGSRVASGRNRPVRTGAPLSVAD